MVAVGAGATAFGASGALAGSVLAGAGAAFGASPALAGSPAFAVSALTAALIFSMTLAVSESGEVVAAAGAAGAGLASPKIFSPLEPF